MTTKPVKAASKTPSARPVALVPVVLTPDEAELLRCYRAMDSLRRSENLFMCQLDAEVCQLDAQTYPMVKNPALSAPVASSDSRLVASAGKRGIA